MFQWIYLTCDPTCLKHVKATPCTTGPDLYIKVSHLPMALKYFKFTVNGVDLCYYINPADPAICISKHELVASPVTYYDSCEACAAAGHTGTSNPPPNDGGHGPPIPPYIPSLPGGGGYGAPDPIGQPGESKGFLAYPCDGIQTPVWVSYWEGMPKRISYFSYAGFCWSVDTTGDPSIITDDAINIFDTFDNCDDCSLGVACILCADSVLHNTTEALYVRVRDLPTEIIYFEHNGNCYSLNPLSVQIVIPPGAVTVRPEPAFDNCDECIKGRLCEPCTEGGPSVWVSARDCPAEEMWFKFKGYCFHYNPDSNLVVKGENDVQLTPQAQFSSCEQCICGSVIPENLGIKAHQCEGESQEAVQLWVPIAYIPTENWIWRVDNRCYFVDISETPQVMPEGSSPVRPHNEFPTCSACKTGKTGGGGGGGQTGQPGGGTDGGGGTTDHPHGPGFIINPPPKPGGGSGGGGPPTNPPPPPPEKPYFQLKDCETGMLVDMSIYQSIIGVFNSLPIVRVDGRCYQVTGLRTVNPVGTLVEHWEEVWYSCTECLANNQWVQLRKCSDNSLSGCWVSIAHWKAAGGSGTTMKMSDGGCYYADPTSRTSTLPGCVLTVHDFFSSCGACTPSTKRWYHKYQWNYHCVDGPDEEATFVETLCLTSVPSVGEWYDSGNDGIQEIYYYWIADTFCVDGDTPPTAPAVPAPPSGVSRPTFCDAAGCSTAQFGIYPVDKANGVLPHGGPGVAAISNGSYFTQNEDDTWSLTWSGITFISSSPSVNPPIDVSKWPNVTQSGIEYYLAWIACCDDCIATPEDPSTSPNNLQVTPGDEWDCSLCCGETTECAAWDETVFRAPADSCKSTDPDTGGPSCTDVKTDTWIGGEITWDFNEIDGWTYTVCASEDGKTVEPQVSFTPFILGTNFGSYYTFTKNQGYNWVRRCSGATGRYWLESACTFSSETILDGRPVYIDISDAEVPPP